MKLLDIIEMTSALNFNANITIQQTGKGRGVFATKKFIQREIVVIGRRIEEVRERTLYSIQMDFDLHINLNEHARFINHSCNPNTGVRNNQLGGYDFIALRDIKAGEEITFDYETTEYELITVFQCLCNSRCCRGRILGFQFREQLLRDRYGDYIADYLQQKQSTD